MHPHNRIPLGLVLIFLGLLSGACTVHYVADYDAEVKADILRVAKQVDLFWGKLLATPVDQRQYAKFKDDYIRIETDLRGLLMQNRIRPLNELSTQQSQIALELWEQDMADHKNNEGISDFIAKRHRQDFVRVFVAMAKGEEAKQLDE